LSHSFADFGCGQYTVSCFNQRFLIFVELYNNSTVIPNPIGFFSTAVSNARMSRSINVGVLLFVFGLLSVSVLKAKPSPSAESKPKPNSGYDDKNIICRRHASLVIPMQWLPTVTITQTILCLHEDINQYRRVGGNSRTSVFRNSDKISKEYVH